MCVCLRLFVSFGKEGGLEKGVDVTLLIYAFKSLRGVVKKETACPSVAWRSCEQ